jgi:hypothetical protein
MAVVAGVRLVRLPRNDARIVSAMCRVLFAVR